MLMEVNNVIVNLISQEKKIRLSHLRRCASKIHRIENL